MNATLYDPSDVAFGAQPLLADDKWIPFTDQRTFNNAYLWGKPQP